MQESKIIRLIIPTASRIGDPNVNGYVYTEEMFNNMVSEVMESKRPIFLTDRLPSSNDIIEITMIDAATILGTVKKIEDGFITVEPYNEDSARKITGFLKDGYVAGMRYLTSLRDSYMRLIAYDMIKNPYSTKSNTEVDNENPNTIPQKVCLRCNGKGILYSLYSVRRCPVCDGTGNYNTNCKSYTRRRKNQINDKGGSPMDFSEALKKVKEGKKIYRSNWNGPNQFVVYQKGYPDGIPCNKQTAEAWGMKEGDLFKCRPYLQIQCTDGSHQMWAPSVSDVLEEDWYIIPDTTDDATVTTKEEPASQTSLQDISIKELVETNFFVLNAKAIRDIVYENNISVQEAAERYAVAENWNDGSSPALREFIFLCKRFSIEGLAYMVDEYLQSRRI